jgi:hypothetical protein
LSPQVEKIKEIEMIPTDLGPFDDTAAAFGLTQVVFADATERMAVAVLMFRKRLDPTLTFQKVFRKLQFGSVLHWLQSELDQLAPQGATEADIDVMRRCCARFQALSKWRNERIHARVRQIGNGLALYDSRTGQRLSMSGHECWKIVQGLALAMFEMDNHLSSLLRDLDMSKELDAIFQEMEVTDDGS